ncbi:hypothetical protein LP52_15445 [Streptomonospora alba]|uniref:Transposase n=1 Tax=Streptomonospora alba TaxID=183763 RepID=A0A0C2G499_9ACTN|nr:hypothetical protein LP52_15445 [Streptomonospora alba]
MESPLRREAHGGFGERPGETDWRQRQHRAPGRLNRHSGIGYHTPASVHFGTAEHVRAQRATALDKAYTAHPERFSRRPRPPRIPQEAWINDPAKRPDPTPQNL